MQTFWKEIIIIIIINKLKNVWLFAMLLLFCYYYHKYFFINLNILNIDVLSPTGNQHHETIYNYYFYYY